MKFVLRALLIGLLVAVAQPALAADRWLQATTQHFVVHGAIDEAKLREAASDLERYHRLLSGVMHMDSQAPVARLDIYLVSEQSDLKQVDPEIDRHVAGFYRAGPGGRMALATWNTRDRDQARRILQHEYAHHFMLQYFSYPYPAWFIEGFAEYFATATVQGDTIQLGGAAPGRVASLESRPWISLDTLLAPKPGQAAGEMAYAQGWLLTHYLLRDPARAEQLQAYFAALRGGQAESEAFTAAFKTDKATLQRQLTSYAHSGMTVTVIPIKPLAPADVTVTPMSPAAGELLLPSLRLMQGRHGETDDQAAAFLGQITKSAAKYPGDPLAIRTQAHAEQVFGDPVIAVATLRGADILQAYPYSQYLLGVSYLSVARRDPGQKTAATAEAKKAFARALKLDPGFYPALYRYARTLPPESDTVLDVLVQAHLLAPQVEQIRIDAVLALLRKGEYDAGGALIAPLARAPHMNINVAAAQILAEDASAHRAPANDQALFKAARARLESAVSDQRK